jgi:hypothetical protein
MALIFIVRHAVRRRRPEEFTPFMPTGIKPWQFGYCSIFTVSAQPTTHCALWASTPLGGRKLDRHVRGGAHCPRTTIGIALAPERLKQQKKLLGQHLRRLNKKLNCPLVWADRLKIQSIKRER